MKLATLAMTGVVASAIATGPVAAQEVSGTWLRDNGSSKVRIARCGEALCGHIVWLRDSTRKDAEAARVFYDMKPSGPGEWEGSAYNPEDGNTYYGKMTLSGDRLTTSGCILGGLVCKSMQWSRSD